MKTKITFLYYNLSALEMQVQKRKGIYLQFTKCCGIIFNKDKAKIIIKKEKNKVTLKLVCGYKCRLSYNKFTEKGMNNNDPKYFPILN